MKTTPTPLDSVPVSQLRALEEQFSVLPPRLLTGQAAELIGVSRQSVRLMGERIDGLLVERDPCGHRLFSRDLCVAIRYARELLYRFDDQEDG